VLRLRLLLWRIWSIAHQRDTCPKLTVREAPEISRYKHLQDAGPEGAGHGGQLRRQRQAVEHARQPQRQPCVRLRRVHQLEQLLRFLEAACGKGSMSCLLSKISWQSHIVVHHSEQLHGVVKVAK